MKVLKDGKFLNFQLDDDKVVKYDLSNGKTIGKSGREVKTLCSQLSGYGLNHILDSFEDKNYAEFLKFVYNECSSSVTNMGTVLNKAKKMSNYEQIFSAGVKVRHGFRYRINEIPKVLIKFCKKHDVILSEELFEASILNPNILTVFDDCQFVSLNIGVFVKLLEYQRYYNEGRESVLLHIIKKYSYNAKSLLYYIDKMMTYEALNYSFVREFEDYLNMMSAISTKFEKYPKNFLTTHKIAVRNYNSLKKEFPEELFSKRIKPELEFSFGNYKIIYPKTTQDIKDEAVSMNHCVARYIEDIIDGNTDVLFLRKKDSLDKSLVTIEVAGLNVAQAKRNYNHEPSEQEFVVINAYKEYLRKLGGNKNVA